MSARTRRRVRAAPRRKAPAAPGPILRSSGVNRATAEEIPRSLHSKSDAIAARGSVPIPVEIRMA